VHRYVSRSKCRVPSERTIEYTTQNTPSEWLRAGAQIPAESGTPSRDRPGTAVSTAPAGSQSARFRERYSGMLGNHSKELVAR
jgi:hypothetical protein